MIKCFLLAMGIIFCSDKPVDVKCLNTQLDFYVALNRHIQGSVNLAVNECLLDASGCCAWHGGIDHYDNDQAVFICNDGTESPTCKGYDKEIEEPGW